MDAGEKGFWLLPSKGHVHDRLPQFLKAAVDAGMTTPGIIIVDHDDFEANIAAYEVLALPSGWRIEVSPDAPNTAASTEWARRTFCADAKWIGWMSDDVAPVTHQWDVKAISHLTGWNVVSTDDGVFAPKKLNGATVWSGDLVRAVGFLYAPGLKHFYIDDCWERLGKLTGCWQCRMDILVRHEHDMITGRLDHMTSNKNAFWDNDQQAFNDWLKHGEHAAAERILALMVSKGLKKVDADLKGVSLMLACPSMTRRYEGVFMDSRVATEKHVRAAGGEFDFKELPYTSDITIARVKLFGEFLRSDHTHMLLVDDDMGWNPADVIRMISYKKDFVAVAGPRKTVPPTFAVSSADEDGQPLPVQVDPETGLLIVTDVGMAFCLVTKAWAVRMAQHYKDLTFRSPDGRDEVCIFLPLIVNGRYRSEDFAACYRWRQIGGQVYIDGAVKLDHVGISVYSGAWLDHLQRMMEAQEQAA